MSFEAVSNGEGLFNIPSVPPGTYTVTVVAHRVQDGGAQGRPRRAGDAGAVKAVLEVGQLTETVTVASQLRTDQHADGDGVVDAQLRSAATGCRRRRGTRSTRSRSCPGVNTATSNRESRINGLPESFVSITLDGVSNNDNFLRSSDSFFASVTPRQDAVEAVNVTTAVQGAQTGGSGAVSINFTTRSGTNRFKGSGYEYFRDTDGLAAQHELLVQQAERTAEEQHQAESVSASASADRS